MNKVVKRDIHGILLLDKPLGLSSNAALQKVKRIYSASKVGHTGSLDPLASGLLPICFGEATKFSQYLLDSDKTYLVQAKLGVTTSTGDAEGEIVEEKTFEPYSENAIREVLTLFQGEMDQVPPMYSALKYQGQPLYRLARKGLTIDRKARTIVVYENELISFDEVSFTFKVKCSKGTYVRSLVEDMGKHMACGAHVSFLRRIGVGPYQESHFITIDQLEKIDKNYDALDHLLLPMLSAVKSWPMTHLDNESIVKIRNGQSVSISSTFTEKTQLILLSQENQFIGIGEVHENNRIKPKRLIKTEMLI